MVITIANGIYTLRQPYHSMILASGKYKETQGCYIISAILNLGVSIIMVYRFGLIGVAIGTLVSMIYQTVYMSWYVINKVLELKYTEFFKLVFTDVTVFILGYYISKLVLRQVESYLDWVIVAVMVALIVLAITIILNLVLYPKNIRKMMEKIRK